MNTKTETTYEFEGKQYRPTGERRYPRTGEIAMDDYDGVFKAKHDFRIVANRILEEVPADVPVVRVSFLTKNNIEDGGFARTVVLSPVGVHPAQRDAADAVREYWDTVSEIIEDVELIHLAFEPNSNGLAWNWTIPRESSCWKNFIQPVIDELSKPKRPALLDDPRYVAAVEHVNNVLAKFDKPPVERLEPSNRNGGPRMCNCPISVTVNKALGFEPADDKGYYDQYTGVTAVTGTSFTSISGPSNGSSASIQHIPTHRPEVGSFVAWADNHIDGRDKELAEARDA